jgi:hypothetical protein
VKSPMQLWTSVAKELATWCNASATLDIKYVERRSEHEGLSFLTISLPTFGKDFQKSLDLGFVGRNLFQGFPWQAGLPRFLGGFLDLVFDRSSGLLKDEPDIDAILAVRQLTLMFSKVLSPCSDARERQAMKDYVLCEQEVRVSDSQISNQQWLDFRRISALLFSTVFSKVDRDVYFGALVPKHGPGATADRLRGNAKFRQKTWPARLEGILPFGEFALPNWRYFDELAEVDFLEPGDEIPVRVISVPKTHKAPRIIGIEPTAMQYSQQAIAGSILRWIREDKTLRSMIGFDDQIPNQEMAQKGSREQTLATLDLSEASDRVSNQHVRNLVAPFPHLHRALDATRSRKAVVLGEGVLRLAKYASMGSALCFPVEAMVFLTIIFIGIEKELNKPLSHKAINRLVGSVRVFGDDIIVPSDCVPAVIEALESFGIRVNLNKSFWNGKFRESCGKEYYDGHDISIVKVRRESPTSRQNAREVNSYVVLRNQLYQAGYWKTCEAMDRYIQMVIKHYPVVLPSSRVVGRHSFLGFNVERVSLETFTPMVKGYRIRAILPEDPLSDYGALLKCLLILNRQNEDKSLLSIPRDTEEFLDPLILDESDSLPTVSAKHLERSGRPLAVTLKLGWSPPF